MKWFKLERVELFLEENEKIGVVDKGFLVGSL